ncbi:MULTISPECIES: thiamine-phosphate kinase [unclassified Beijerinckia]|uniref:thiamine-phosphate kinase n=1 Tax=unclassified Beijerinckia TaxID=2638183 RepID=UPI000897CDA4|nr:MULTISPECIES: thiamine-phosphate kinase [unclassified Beijerinckia]MDH7794714.1 thiamine-monophosphate kinase [Beijerinckia sp. GAS462]SEB72363.1 thiamine-phosphate kinase [Beijerinckia sp. 28-YEA-48]
MAADFSEDDLIATLLAPLAGRAGLGLRDDAALIDIPEGMQVVATKDALVAGVHFFADDAPDDIARKALRVNISDLAAKASDPLGFLLSIALTENIDRKWMTAFVQGLREDGALYHCPLIGGDTVRTTGPLVISVTALGTVPRGRMALRTGAKAGDIIYVSGTIGDSALGLRLRLKSERDAGWCSRLSVAVQAHLLRRYLLPSPRLALAHVVRAYAHGAMDVSDGLAGDLAKMLRVSNVGGDVRLADIPLSDAARAAVALDSSLIDGAVTGGDDYEILCTVPPQNAAAFESAAKGTGVPVTAIGEVTADAGGLPRFIDGAGVARTFEKGSYSHF